MAYRTNISKRDRGGAIAAVIAVHVALFMALLNLSGNLGSRVPESVIRVFNIAEVQPPPPPPPPPPPKPRPQARAAQRQGGSAPRNIRSEATPVHAPKPAVVVPPVPQIAASETPRQGTQSTQGASSFRGTGTGSGGNGTGTGNGSGAGAGGSDGGVAEPPHLVTPVLTGSAFPNSVLEQWPRGTTVFVRLRVDARGYVSECAVDRGTGVPSIDSEICSLAHERLRFTPALNRSGQAVAGWFGYAQRAPR